MANKKEFARQMRTNAVKDREGNVTISWDLWEQIADLVEDNKEWISVKDRMPDSNTLVLCVGARGGMFLGYVKFIVEKEKTAYTYVPNARGGRETAFWMPLPEPPKEGE